MSPASGAWRPLIILNKDDLPVPLRPIKPIRSRDKIERLAFSSKGRSPKASFISLRVIKGVELIKRLWGRKIVIKGQLNQVVCQLGRNIASEQRINTTSLIACLGCTGVYLHY